MNVFWVIASDLICYFCDLNIAWILMSMGLSSQSIGWLLQLVQKSSDFVQAWHLIPLIVISCSVSGFLLSHWYFIHSYPLLSLCLSCNLGSSFADNFSPHLCNVLEDHFFWKFVCFLSPSEQALETNCCSYSRLVSAVDKTMRTWRPVWECKWKSLKLSSFQ